MPRAVDVDLTSDLTNTITGRSFRRKQNKLPALFGRKGKCSHGLVDVVGHAGCAESRKEDSRGWLAWGRMKRVEVSVRKM